MSFTYKFAILGGTFDHFHVGHEQFIAAAFDKAQNVTIGIVKESFSLDKTFPNNIEAYEVREQNLKSFLHKLNVSTRADIIPISDIYGTSLTDENIEVIVVTDSTRANAEQINLERKKRAMSPLSIEVIPYVLGDDGKIVSSGRIREGVIDRQGNSYLKFFLGKLEYHLPDKLRTTLQQPIGVVVSDLQEITKIIPSSSLVITVGDIVSSSLKEVGYPITLSIIDYRTRRQKIDEKIIQKYFSVVHKTLTNPAGTINPKIAEILLVSLSTYNKFKEAQIIAVVNGEEDLLALPAILLSPLNSFVIYGQYNVGVCVVEVTEETKSRVKLYLEQF